jgi:hypothetical protein
VKIVQSVDAQKDVDDISRTHYEDLPDESLSDAVRELGEECTLRRIVPGDFSAGESCPLQPASA